MGPHSTRSKFRGELATPISGKGMNIARNKDELDRAYRDVEFEWYRKIPLLLDHYGINKDLPEEMRNILLVLALAQETVPGFSVNTSNSDRSKRGRPSTIPPQMLYDFMILRQSGVGPAEAARRLNSKGPWRGKVPPGINTRYTEQDRRGGLTELARVIEEDDRTK